MGEGAIINVERGRVRFREDAEGLAYELRPSRPSLRPGGSNGQNGQNGQSDGAGHEVSSDGADAAPDGLDVYKVDEAAPDGEGGTFLGRLVHGRQGWRPEMVKRDRLREQLVVIARAWNRALVLKK